MSEFKDEVDWEQNISEEKLLEVIENSLVILNEERFKDRVFKNEVSRALPMLATPADVIPYTNSVIGFGGAAVLSLIKALCIPVLHGCMVDDKASGLSGCSYIDLVNAYNTPTLPEDADDDVKKRWELIRDIMEKTRNQLNSYGVSCICDYMILQGQAFAILYRNGEFKLVHLYRGVVHMLYTLDEDIEEVELEERTRVWQVDRDDLYVTGRYKHLNEEDGITITQLYLAGWKHALSLPTQIADRHAAELIESEEREKEEKAKKEAAARSKTKKPQSCDISGSVALDEETSPLVPCSEIGDDTGAVSPDDLSHILKRVTVLDLSHYCGRSKTPYFEGEVILMKERNLFMLSIDFLHIEEDCQELSILIRDDYDNSVREDLKKCLVEYLMGKSVEKEMAEQAVLRIMEVPKGYQPFIEFAERIRCKLIDYHVIYNKELSACASKLGRRMARGFLKIIKHMHISGYCWNGDWSVSDMKVRSDGKKFIITAKAQHLVSGEGIKADLKKFSEILFPYYTYEVEVIF
ncbi:hypothetical protein PR202_gb21046 [Eleusine coracana subsp. coracana]|uniref:MINDY deubiquitinase domain-containing protein n=1 Tax=Eleusine coracana subsp. coracana TaxID=191504 RepID=A0AAV5FC91_ELECO|nr:hypothetical protein PR202_gb21046 [Eleusine coracana subsp. coracana]